ncbi:MAG: TIGR02444 family protein [Gammaproteobacteria bacterium]
MSESNELPSHPFWGYSLRLYAQPGVQQACLQLQDEFDLDVNLVLFCVWTGAEGPGELRPEELAQCIAQGGLWQREVVKPLRLIRRRLKTESMGAPQALSAAFRPGVQSLEIEAEHVQQLILADIVPVQRGTTGPGVAVANLLAYTHSSGLAPTGPVRQFLLTILGRAFPAEDEDFSEYWPV